MVMSTFLPSLMPHAKRNKTLIQRADLETQARTNTKMPKEKVMLKLTNPTPTFDSTKTKIKKELTVIPRRRQSKPKIILFLHPHSLPETKMLAQLKSIATILANMINLKEKTKNKE